MAMNELDLSRAALLTLDFQNYGVHPQGYWASHGEPDWPAIARPAVDTTAKVLAAVRRHRVLIIHVGLAWRPGSPEMNVTAPLFANAAERSVEGSWGSEFYSPVAPGPGELVIYKRGVSALAGTELDRLLRLRDVNTLVLTGVATQFAVEGTAREAVDRGYRVLVLEDCCASRIREVHRFSIDVILRRLCEVTTARVSLEPSTATATEPTQPAAPAALGIAAPAATEHTSNCGFTFGFTAAGGRLAGASGG
jgi:nicotinamidase-related amidase